MCLVYSCIVWLLSGPVHAEAVSFLKDVAPILDQRNCSAAQCHGSPYGKGGLRLSLVASSPELDAEPIGYDEKSRRINLIEPVNSLFLIKGANKIPHGGGEMMPVGGDDYKTCLAWIKEGAAADVKPVSISKLEVEPARLVLRKDGDKHPIKVTVLFSDGDEREMTKLARYFSDRPSVADVLSNGTILRNGEGEAQVLVRVLGFTAQIEVVCRSNAEAQQIKSLSVWTGGLSERYRQMDGAKARADFIASSPVKQWIKDGVARTEMIARLYRRHVGRLPHEEELQEAMKFVEEARDAERALIEWAWILQTSWEALSR